MKGINVCRHGHRRGMMMMGVGCERKVHFVDPSELLALIVFPLDCNESGHTQLFTLQQELLLWSLSDECVSVLHPKISSAG